MKISKKIKRNNIKKNIKKTKKRGKELLGTGGFGAVYTPRLQFVDESDRVL